MQSELSAVSRTQGRQAEWANEGLVLASPRGLVLSLCHPGGLSFLHLPSASQSVTVSQEVTQRSVSWHVSVFWHHTSRGSHREFFYNLPNGREAGKSPSDLQCNSQSGIWEQLSLSVVTCCPASVLARKPFPCLAAGQKKRGFPVTGSSALMPGTSKYQ